MMSVSLDAVTADDFKARVGEAFRLSLPDGRLDLRLASVRRAGQSGREGGAFALLFVAPPGPWLPQAIYPLANEHLGTLEIFVVPIGPAEGGNGYEAVFA